MPLSCGSLAIGEHLINHLIHTIVLGYLSYSEIIGLGFSGESFDGGGRHEECLDHNPE